MSSARLTHILAGSLRSWRGRLALCAGATLLAASGALAAQQSRPAGATPPAAGVAAPQDRAVKPDTPDATREELTQLLEQSLRRASDGSLAAGERTRAQDDAAAIRRRLEVGDFRVGDRFVLTVIADSVRRAEMSVTDGPALEFGVLPELRIGGILRAELERAIHQHLSRYYRTPEVRVQFLTRVSIAGAVQKPGTYVVPPFALVSDVLMQAGGPLPQANTDKIIVMRGGREVVSEKAYRQAARDGLTIEALGLQPGDEIRVSDRGGRRNWGQIATIAAFSVSIFTAVLALIRSSYSE